MQSRSDSKQTHDSYSTTTTAYTVCDSNPDPHPEAWPGALHYVEEHLEQEGVADYWDSCQKIVVTETWRHTVWSARLVRGMGVASRANTARYVHQKSGLRRATAHGGESYKFLCRATAQGGRRAICHSAAKLLSSIWMAAHKRITFPLLNIRTQRKRELNTSISPLKTWRR